MEAWKTPPMRIMPVVEALSRAARITIEVRDGTFATCFWKAKAMTTEHEHTKNFVYIYRDKSGNPLYVGRGHEIWRALSHAGPIAHNEDLTIKLNSLNSYTIEVAGPFSSSEVVQVVEAALISALSATPSLERRLCNKIGGVGEGVFRPLGVSAEFANRASQGPLDEGQLKKLSHGRPVLLVYLGPEKLGDREGVDLAHPPSESTIEERMVKWWQLDRYMDEWRASPRLVPAMLVAVSGTPTHRVVVGSLEIDTDLSKLPWKRSAKGRLSEITVHANRQLDFGEIRGRRLEPELVKFGSIRSQFFKII
jgi:hypothetical protein